MLVSAGSDGIARLWQLPVAKPKRIDSKGAARVFVVSHEGNRATSAGADEIVRVWTLAEGKLVRTLNAHANVVYTVAYSPKGDLLATGGDDKLIKYWRPPMAGSCVRARVTGAQSTPCRSTPMAPAWRRVR